MVALSVGASRVRALLVCTRPKQWVKNAFVLAPITFARKLDEPRAVALAVLAVVSFSALSSSVYVLNDVVDRDSDARHPDKARRPIASGLLPVAVAVPFGLGLAALGVALAAPLGMFTVGAALAYLALNVAYTFALKRVAWLDVLAIGLGFQLRVLAGSFAVQVRPSRWLLGMTLLMALFLGLGKRLHERGTGEDAAERRGALRGYPPHVLRPIHALVGALTAGAYTLYTFLPATAAWLGTSLLPLTAPFALTGMWRFSRLTRETGRAASPTDRMLRDPLFVVAAVGYALTALLVVYGA